MQPNEIVEGIVGAFDGVIPKSSWGETSLFYNPGKFFLMEFTFALSKKKMETMINHQTWIVTEYLG